MRATRDPPLRYIVTLPPSLPLQESDTVFRAHIAERGLSFGGYLEELRVKLSTPASTGSAGPRSPLGIEQLEAHLRHRALGLERPLVVAIDGRSGVGKSTVAERLGSTLDALIVSGDDFYAGGVAVRTDPPAVLAEVCIDWRRLRSVVVALIETGKARFHAFDWERFDGSLRPSATLLTARSVVIVEGVYSARPQLRDLMDVTILIELESTTRMQRLLAREGTIDAWERQWHRAEDWYFSQTAPRESFDLVIDGRLTYHG